MKTIIKETVVTLYYTVLLITGAVVLSLGVLQGMAWLVDKYMGVFI